MGNTFPRVRIACWDFVAKSVTKYGVDWKLRNSFSFHVTSSYIPQPRPRVILILKMPKPISAVSLISFHLFLLKCLHSAFFGLNVRLSNGDFGI